MRVTERKLSRLLQGAQCEDSDSSRGDSGDSSDSNDSSLRTVTASEVTVVILEIVMTAV